MERKVSWVCHQLNLELVALARSHRYLAADARSQYEDKQAATVDGCKVVSLDWLLDSEKAKKKRPEKKYLFSSAAAPSTSGQVDGVLAATKTNGSKKRTVDKKAESDVDEEPPTKKQRDGQIAKSKNLKVLVDEGCQFAGKNHMISSGATLTGNSQL
jgi:poly [ADP-ribose] polymerase